MNGRLTGEELAEERYCRIGEVAEAMGISRRVLRRWDEIGLVSPSRTWSGYREYGPDDLERLRRVMVYRELGFDSDRIREVLDAPVAAAMSELEDSQVALEGKIVELQEILKTLNKLISLNQAEGGFGASDSTCVLGIVIRVRVKMMGTGRGRPRPGGPVAGNGWNTASGR